jgi:hypothetical protein
MGQGEEKEMNSTFVKAPKGTITPPDPHKHVQYALGMLLGVDDFVQEHAYLSGHNQWLARELLGYGTVSGLEVSTDVDDEKGPRVLVSSGVAVSTRGQLIRVPQEQYAYLNNWLAASKEQISAHPEDTLTAYVALSYTASSVDDVPVAGDPNRGPDTLMAPSRLADDFILELSLNAPEQREERALRSFISWLKRVSLVDAEDENVTSLTQFREAVRKAAGHDGKNDMPFAQDSSQSKLTVPARRANEYWQAAFQLWITELRPLWQAKSSRWDVPDDEPVLLAALRMKIAPDKDNNWQVVIPKKASPVTIHEDERPYLLSTHLLQAWLLSEPRALSETEIVVNEIEVDETNIEEDEVVETQEGELPCQIVAAGTVKCDGTSAQPVYNELQAHIQEDGLISVHFKGYEDKTPYVVQALPLWNNKTRACTVCFDRFQENSFLLRISNARGDVMLMEDLPQLELMIQVVQYTVPASPAKKAKTGRRNRR